MGSELLLWWNLALVTVAGILSAWPQILAGAALSVVIALLRRGSGKDTRKP